MNRIERGRFRLAMIVSVIAHCGFGLVLWAFSGTGDRLPEMRVYAVNIVSPPPQVEGPPNPGNAAPPEVVEEPVAPEPEPEPVEETTPAPPPAPAPPKEKPREPSPAPEATKQPKSEETETETAEPEPEESEPEEAEPTPAPGGGEGGGSGASQGDNADASSAGGEDLDIRLRGVQCPSATYCANIVLQLRRYFRPPEGSSNDEAEVFFYIHRDGSVSGIKLLHGSGRYEFRIAAMEAVEQAGLNHAFGEIPESFSVDQLPVSFFFRPAR